MEPGELAREVVDVIAEKKGSDIVLLDLRRLAGFTDYFVIGSGASERQIKALLGEIVSHMEEQDLAPLSVEGTPESGWVLLDFGSVIVHIFAPPVREYYQLEQLWKEAPLVVRMK